jgi:hypothetical protein
MSGMPRGVKLLAPLGIPDTEVIIIIIIISLIPIKLLSL